jgi:hypothetical protein
MWSNHIGSKDITCQYENITTLITMKIRIVQKLCVKLKVGDIANF